jgi:hypothetical protein
MIPWVLVEIGFIMVCGLPDFWLFQAQMGGFRG